MNCNHCGSQMRDSSTTFTIVNKEVVYVVEHVPCLECPVCEHISFSQDVAKKLECYTSGRVIVVPTRHREASVFKYGDPFIEISKQSISSSAVNIPFEVGVPGTADDRPSVPLKKLKSE